jgi:hypothetical protein
MHNPRKDDRQSVQSCYHNSRQMTTVYKTVKYPGKVDLLLYISCLR